MDNTRSFWSWFGTSETRFRNINAESRDQLLDEMLEALHAYCPALWFETGCADDGINELIVSAEGNINHFSAVRRLIAAAPRIPQWRFIAVKPANGFGFQTSYADITFSPEATWYLPLHSASDPSALSLRIAYAHYDTARSHDFLAGTFIMLEAALGELTLAERVHHIEVAALPSSPESSGYYPLAELVNLIGQSENRACARDTIWL